MTSFALPIDLGLPLIALSGTGPASDRTIDDGDLIRELVRTGDEDLFMLLVERYRDRVFRLAVSILGPGRESEAEDVAQEVFVQVFRKIQTFRHDSQFSTWVFRMTRNRTIDHLRAARMRHRHVGDEILETMPTVDGAEHPQRALEADQRRRSVLEHVHRLPEMQRTVIYLYYWTGTGVAQIAELLDMNVQTVKSHLHRGRRRLALQLRSEGRHHG